MKNIIASIDFSDVSSAVIKHAAEQADAFDAKLHLVHVWDPEVLIDSGYGAEPALAMNVHDERLESLKKRTEEEAEQLRAKGRFCDGTVLIGRPHKAIIKHASETAADLVVIGSHGHSALGSLLMGSCASALVRKACFPVLVIPALEADEERE